MLLSALSNPSGSKSLLASSRLSDMYVAALCRLRVRPIELTHRLCRLTTRGAKGGRPVLLVLETCGALVNGETGGVHHRATTAVVANIPDE